MNNPFIISAVFIAFGVALFASCWIKRNVERLIAGEKAWSRTPFGEKMLRPAGEVRVVSGRAIASRLPGFGEEGILSEREIARLSDLLDRDCRNVEG